MWLLFFVALSAATVSADSGSLLVKISGTVVSGKVLPLPNSTAMARCFFFFSFLFFFFPSLLEEI
jgi:hypothetical protein